MQHCSPAHSSECGCACAFGALHVSQTADVCEIKNEIERDGKERERMGEKN